MDGIELEILWSNVLSTVDDQAATLQRVAFSPWETLVQALLFSNEAAYVN